MKLLTRIYSVFFTFAFFACGMGLAVLSPKVVFWLSFLSLCALFLLAVQLMWRKVEPLPVTAFAGLSIGLSIASGIHYYFR